MTEPGTHTHQEILSQPEAWESALAVFRRQRADLTRFWQAHPVDRVVFTGCGSTYYLSLTAAALFQALTGIPSVARPASELVLFPELVFPPRQRSALVAISRSGETSETLQALAAFQELQHGPTLGITCSSGSPLASAVDLLLAVDAAQEVSLAQTRSFTSMTLLAQAVAAHQAGLPAAETLAPLPALAGRLLSGFGSLSTRLGQSAQIERFFFLGAGFLYGIACEAMLKMKEMSLSYSEAYHPLEFRHGPMAMVDSRSLVVGLCSPSSLTAEAAVLGHMHSLGGQILGLSEGSLPKPPDWAEWIALESGLPAWAQPVLYLPNLQLLAYHRALLRGQDPDRPHNLGAVVHLDTMHSFVQESKT